MTSLIFGTIYMGHHAIVQHRREKQRVKNYSRWEGLRDEYDEQRQTQRESRSLDIQRTGQTTWEDDNKPILTLRDQQEANDARTGWRPQESWDGPQLTAVKTAAAAEKVNSRRSLDIGQLAQHPRAVSDNRMNQPASRSSLGVHEPTTYQPPAHAPISRNKTGAWDEDLPARLNVQRRNWDDQNGSAGVSRTTSQQSTQQNTPSPTVGTRSTSHLHQVQNSSDPAPTSGYFAANPEQTSRVQHHDAVESHVPGGHMAQLLDMKTPHEEKDMEEWWKN